MQLHIVPTHEVPIYRQIMDQIRDAVATGHANVGAKLPSHRELAAQLVIAPLTVKRAYEELEREGLLETRRGLGTFVRSESGDPLAAERRRELLRMDARRLLQRARLAGVSLTDVLRLLREVHREVRQERSGASPTGTPRTLSH